MKHTRYLMVAVCLFLGSFACGCGDSDDEEKSDDPCGSTPVANDSPCTNPEGKTLVCNWCYQGEIWAASCNGGKWLSMKVPGDTCK